MDNDELRPAWQQLKEALEEDLQKGEMYVEKLEGALTMIQNMREDMVISEDSFDQERARIVGAIETTREVMAVIAGWIDELETFQ